MNDFVALTSGQIAELKRLYDQLPAAHQRAANALRTEPPAHRLEGDGLARFIEADAAVGDIYARIRKLLGQ